MNQGRAMRVPDAAQPRSAVPAAGSPPRRPVSRRAFLGAIAAGAATLAAAGGGGSVVQSPGLTLERGVLTTKNWPGRRVRWVLGRPESPRALVVALHGMGGTAESWFAVQHVERVVAGTGLAVASIDGGLTYWHPRGRGPYAGSDTAAMVIEDFVPLLADGGLPTDRIGLLGESMGGYGSLYIGALLGPEKVFAIATLAAALRTSSAGTYPERFDDPADYKTHDVFSRVATLRRIPLYLACGDRDRFRAGNEAFARQVPEATTNFDSGDHVPSWFQSHLAPAVHFLAANAPGTN